MSTALVPQGGLPEAPKVVRVIQPIDKRATAGERNFYRIPTMGLTGNKGYRYRSVNGYNIRSGHFVDPSLFERYFVRAAFREADPADICARFAAKVAQSDTVPSLIVDRLRKLSEGTSMDTAFGDLFRTLLMHTVHGESLLRTTDRAVAKFVFEVTRRPEFIGLAKTTQHDPALAAYVALEILDSDAGVASMVGAFDDDNVGGKVTARGKGMGDLLRDIANAIGADVTESRESREILSSIAGLFAGIGYVDPPMDPSQINTALAMLKRMLSSERHHIYNFSTVCELMGRLEGLYGQAMLASRIGDGEVMDVDVGGPLRSVVPSQFVMLGSPYLRVLFMKKLMEDSLLCLRRIGIDRGGRGPLTIMNDRSSSMTITCNFMGEDVVKADLSNAFALGMVRLCGEMERDAAVIPFNGDVITQAVSSFSTHFGNSKHTIFDSLVNCLSAEACGGTDFGKCLAYYTKFVERMPNMEYGDIIFFSDGHGRAPTGQTAKALRRRLPEGTRVYGFFFTNSEEEKEGVEEANVDMFDVCVGAVMSDQQMVEDAFKRLYLAIMETGMYRGILD